MPTLLISDLIRLYAISVNKFMLCIKFKRRQKVISTFQGFRVVLLLNPLLVVVMPFGHAIAIQISKRLHKLLKNLNSKNHNLLLKKWGSKEGRQFLLNYCFKVYFTIHQDNYFVSQK